MNCMCKHFIYTYYWVKHLLIQFSLFKTLSLLTWTICITQSDIRTYRMTHGRTKWNTHTHSHTTQTQSDTHSDVPTGDTHIHTQVLHIYTVAKTVTHTCTHWHMQTQWLTHTHTHSDTHTHTWSDMCDTQSDTCTYSVTHVLMQYTQSL